MDAQVPYGVALPRQQENVVQLLVDLLLQGPLKAEGVDVLAEDAQQLLVFVGQPGGLFGQAELNDDPPAGASRRVLGLVEDAGRNGENVVGLHLVGLALQKMHALGAEHDAQLIEGVEVLELHIDVGGAGVVVEEVEQRVLLPVHPDIVLVLIQHRALSQRQRLRRHSVRLLCVFCADSV